MTPEMLVSETAASPALNGECFVQVSLFTPGVGMTTFALTPEQAARFYLQVRQAIQELAEREP
jgi:hypothetical protein